MNFFNNIKAKCEKASAKREVDLIDNKINQLREKKAELTGKAEKAGSNKVEKAGSNKSKLHNVAYTANYDNVKSYLLNDKFINKYDDMSSLIDFVKLNEYDDMLIDIAKNLAINVLEISNVTNVTKIFLRIAKKHNVKELSDSEKSYLTNHFVMLYAMKHKAKQYNSLYAIKKCGTEETLLSYSKDRTANVKDIYV